jgi:hypothetical protein
MAQGGSEVNMFHMEHIGMRSGPSVGLFPMRGGKSHVPFALHTGK